MNKKNVTRRNFRSGKYHSRNCPSWKFPFGELSFQATVLQGTVCWGTVRRGKFRRCNIRRRTVPEPINTLTVSLLGSELTERRVIRAGERTIEKVKIFNATPSF